MNHVWKHLVDYLVAHQKTAVDVGWHLAMIVMYFGVARIALWVGSRFIRRVFGQGATRTDSRRNRTLRSLMDNVLRYTVYFVFIILALTQVDPHFVTLLAGAGIIGVAIAFGAQSLVKDVLTGFFILFEDQYGVGDTVLINGLTGTVRSVGLRLTRLQAVTGEEQIIPNGQVQQVVNYSRHESLIIIDVTVGRDADRDIAVTLMGQALHQVAQEHDDGIIGEPQILGIQDVGEKDVQLRAIMQCDPGNSIGVDTDARDAILTHFARSGRITPGTVKIVQTNPIIYESFVRTGRT